MGMALWAFLFVACISCIGLSDCFKIVGNNTIHDDSTRDDFIDETITLAAPHYDTMAAQVEKIKSGSSTMDDVPRKPYRINFVANLSYETTQTVHDQTTSIAEYTTDVALMPGDVAETPVLREDVAETPVIPEDEAEIPVLRDDAAETPVLRDHVSEPPAMPEDLAETPVIPKDVAKTPVLPEDAAATPVVLDLAETPVLREDAAQTPVLPDDAEQTSVMPDDVAQIPVLREDATETPVWPEFSTEASSIPKNRTIPINTPRIAGEHTTRFPLIAGVNTPSKPTNKARLLIPIVILLLLGVCFMIYVVWGRSRRLPVFNDQYVKMKRSSNSSPSRFCQGIHERK